MAKNRDKLFQMLEEGILSWESIATAALRWMSEDDCTAFAESEGIELEEEDDSPVHLYDDEDELREAFAEHWAERLQQCPAYEGDEAARRQLWDVWLQEQRDESNVSDDVADSATLED